MKSRRGGVHHNNPHQQSTLGTGAPGHVGGFKSGHGTFKATGGAVRNRGEGLSGQSQLGKVRKNKRLYG
jgi:hypothetical protein